MKKGGSGKKKKKNMEEHEETPPPPAVNNIPESPSATAPKTNDSRTVDTSPEAFEIAAL